MFHRYCLKQKKVCTSYAVQENGVLYTNILLVSTISILSDTGILGKKIPVLSQPSGVEPKTPDRSIKIYFKVTRQMWQVKKWSGLSNFEGFANSIRPMTNPSPCPPPPPKKSKELNAFFLVDVWIHFLKGSVVCSIKAIHRVQTDWSTLQLTAGWNSKW